VPAEHVTSAWYHVTNVTSRAHTHDVISTCNAARSLVNPRQSPSLHSCTRDTSIYISQRQAATGLGLVSIVTKCSNHCYIWTCRGRHCVSCALTERWSALERCMVKESVQVRRICFLKSPCISFQAHYSVCPVQCHSHIWVDCECTLLVPLFLLTIEKKHQIPSYN